MEENKYLKQIKVSNTKNKSDELLTQFTELISSGKLPAGYILPNENVLCEMLHIGRGTLRGVYSKLETRGFISRSKAGTVVNDINSMAKDGMFSTSLIVAKEEKLIEFLSIVEPAACSLAAKNATEEDINNIYESMIQCERANRDKDFEAVVSHNANFHESIRKASKNPVLVSAIYSSRKTYDDNIVESLVKDTKESRQFMDECLHQHYNLYYAIKTKNEDEAGRIMKEHYLLDLEYSERISDSKK